MATLLRGNRRSDGSSSQFTDSDETIHEKPHVHKHNVGWRRMVRNFTPSWFAVNQGTGIVSILLHQFPYKGLWLRYISYGLFSFNILLFSGFLVLTILRYTLYPEIWTKMIAHPGESMYLGCFPMGFGTIINMMIFACKQWGDWIVYLAWAFWWVDVLLSLTTCLTIPFIVMYRHRLGLQDVTAALLLPIIPTVVASSTGSVLAGVLPNKDHAFTTLVASYVLWGIGEGCTACVLALYFHRLTVHSIPPKEMIVSAFLPIGPLGYGGFGVQQLGRVAITLLPRMGVFVDITHGDTGAGEQLYFLGIFLGMAMWGFGMVWMCLAITGVAVTREFPFNMGWWGCVFPLGVYALCTGLLADNLESNFFRVCTAMISMIVAALWALVAISTFKRVITGEVFEAPCLTDSDTKVYLENHPFDTSSPKCEV